MHPDYRVHSFMKSSVRSFVRSFVGEGSQLSPRTTYSYYGLVCARLSPFLVVQTPRTTYYGARSVRTVARFGSTEAVSCETCRMIQPGDYRIWRQCRRNEPVVRSTCSFLRRCHHDWVVQKWLCRHVSHETSSLLPETVTVSKKCACTT